MVYNDYKSLKVFKSQTRLYLPTTTNLQEKVDGAVFNVSPNLSSSLNFLSLTNLFRYNSDRYKKYRIDLLYKKKIHNKSVNENYRSIIMDQFKNSDVPLVIETGSNTKQNKIIDLSVWMEIFFTKDLNLSTAEIKCKAFINLLTNLINDTDYNGYEKVVLIDLNGWARINPIILLNKELLTNPLSIIVYSAYYYPELMESIKDMKFLLVNTAGNTVLPLDGKDITRENMTLLKTRFKAINDVVFSIDETGNLNPMVTKAEIKIKTREEIVAQIKSKLEKDGSLQSEDISDEDIQKTVNQLDLGEDVTEDQIEDISDSISSNILITSFSRIRNEKEQKKMEELLKKQEFVLDNVKIPDVSIPTTSFGNYMENTNPSLQSSKFVNFTKTYNEKLMEQDIDNAVAILSNTDNKIFITNKEVVDTSDTTSLKKTYKYTLEDEKGNKNVLSFDIPIIIDENYIYTNGSKKIIGHQYILKPLVKTGNDSVQLVTAYNKAFIRRSGRTRQSTNLLTSYIDKNSNYFNVKEGNYLQKNNEYNIGLDLSFFTRKYNSFVINNNKFIFDIDAGIKEFRKINPNMKFAEDVFPIGYNTKTKLPILVNGSESVTDIILDTFDSETKRSILSAKRKPKLITSNIKILSQNFPIILLILFCVGFEDFTRRAKIKTFFIGLDEKPNFDVTRYDSMRLEDSVLYWEKDSIETELLMNGLKSLPLELFTKAELESKDTYTSLLMPFFKNDVSIGSKMDNFKDFLLDTKTKEILKEEKLPTELPDILILASNMLADNSFTLENKSKNLRIRSNEIISDIVYMQVTKAYNLYRKTSHKKRPTKISFKPSAVIDELLSSDTRLVTEFSTLNPLLEIEKARAITFKGLRGIQMDRAMTLPRRAYDESMLGIVGISTSPDANVGIVRQLTTEPKVINARGLLEETGLANVEKLDAANLFTPAELLSPCGVRHDDPDRTSMNYKQSKYMISVNDASPPFIGNRMESVIPYMLSDEFVVDAKMDGKVISKTNDIIVIQYKDGVNKVIDISARVKKNASSGTYVDNTLITKFKQGDSFKKGEIIAYNDKFFTPSRKTKTVSMNQGVVSKLAVISQWDVYEDSGPITNKLANKMGTEMIDERARIVTANTFIDYIATVGTEVKTGDVLLRYNETISDEMAELFGALRAEDGSNIIDDTKSTVSSKYTGTLVDIKIYTTIPLEEMDESLRAIVSRYQSKIATKNKNINKYKNKGDGDLYVAGQIIDELPEVMEVPANGKIKGQYIDKGVLFLFYIKYTDIPKKGDKSVVGYALKNIVSRVIPEGQEPYSEYRPTEEISSILAPLAISARKTPSIFFTMFTNKLMIELKRQVVEMYFGEVPNLGDDF